VGEIFYNVDCQDLFSSWRNESHTGRLRVCEDCVLLIRRILKKNCSGSIYGKIPAAVVAINLLYKIWYQDFVVARFYRINLKFTAINRISLSDIMLNYQSIEVLISVLYH